MTDLFFAINGIIREQRAWRQEHIQMHHADAEGLAAHLAILAAVVERLDKIEERLKMVETERHSG